MFPITQPREILVSALGGFLGLGITALISYLLLGEQLPYSFIVASLGASSVLLFATPNSPLAQPWSLIGGTLLSALVGVLCAWGIDSLVLAIAAALGISILVMFVLRCLHPPGGAVAVLAVLSDATGQGIEGIFLLYPVGLNIVLLTLCGWLINRWLLGRAYPHFDHRQSPKPSEVTFSDADLDYAHARIGSFIDVSHDDLRALFAHASEHARR